jgi:hypothetical protein
MDGIGQAVGCHPCALGIASRHGAPGGDVSSRDSSDAGFVGDARPNVVRHPSLARSKWHSVFEFGRKQIGKPKSDTGHHVSGPAAGPAFQKNRAIVGFANAQRRVPVIVCRAARNPAAGAGLFDAF